MYTPNQKQATSDFIKGACIKASSEPALLDPKDKLLALTSITLAFMAIHNFNFSLN